MATRENSMGCATHEADLVLYHYGETDVTARARIEDHLRACAVCRQSLDEMAKLMPLTVAQDQPPPEFWTDYSRELRHRIDIVTENTSVWSSLAAWLRPLPLTAFAACAVMLLAVTFTVGKKYWPKGDAPVDDDVVAIMSASQDLELLRDLEILDALDVLETISTDKRGA